MSRRRALLESFVRAKNDLAEMEAKPVPAAGPYRTNHLRAIKELNETLKSLYELFELERMRPADHDALHS